MTARNTRSFRAFVLPARRPAMAQRRTRQALTDPSNAIIPAGTTELVPADMPDPNSLVAYPQAPRSKRPRPIVAEPKSSLWFGDNLDVLSGGGRCPRSAERSDAGCPKSGSRGGHLSIGAGSHLPAHSGADNRRHLGARCPTTAPERGELAPSPSAVLPSDGASGASVSLGRPSARDQCDRLALILSDRFRRCVCVNRKNFLFTQTQSKVQRGG